MNDNFWDYYSSIGENPGISLEDPRGPVISSETVDQIAIDSLKWHYKELNPMDQELVKAFQRVLQYYGVYVV